MSETRTVTTAAELDALAEKCAHGPVVVSAGIAGRDIWTAYPTEHGPRWIGLEYDLDYFDMDVERKQHWLYDALDYEVVTVLHEPGTPIHADAMSAPVREGQK